MGKKVRTLRLAMFSKNVSEEKEAEKLLREKGILKEFRSRPYCGSERFRRMQRNFYKCYHYKREWSISEREACWRG